MDAVKAQATIENEVAWSMVSPGTAITWLVILSVAVMFLRETARIMAPGMAKARGKPTGTGASHGSAPSGVSLLAPLLAGGLPHADALFLRSASVLRQAIAGDVGAHRTAVHLEVQVEASIQAARRLNSTRANQLSVSTAPHVSLAVLVARAVAAGLRAAPGLSAAPSCNAPGDSLVALREPFVGLVGLPMAASERAGSSTGSDGAADAK